jgi:toxin ParE1/3/4
MGLVDKLPEAKASLQSIVDRIAEDNLPAALNWLQEIESVFGLLSTQPLMGQELVTKRLGKLRHHVFGNYLIYYRPISGGVQILDVIHAARDQDRLV